MVKNKYKKEWLGWAAYGNIRSRCTLQARGGYPGKVAEVFQNGGKSEEKFVKQRLIFSV